MPASRSISLSIASAFLMRMFSKSGCPSSQARRTCWMLNLMGVSGFLTSCAICRAISPQARIRSARSSSVTSSSVTTTPLRVPKLPRRRARTRTRRSPTWRSELVSSSVPSKNFVNQPVRASPSSPSLGNGRPTKPTLPRISSARGFTSVTRPPGSSATIPTAASSMISWVRREVRTSCLRERRTRPTILLKALNTAPNSSVRFAGNRIARSPEPTLSDAI